MCYNRRMQPHTKTAGRSAFIGAMHCAWLFVSMFSGICSAEPHAPAFIWLEAERPSKSDVPRVAWLAPANERERDVLSAGDWLTCALPAGRTGMAVYTLHAPTSSAYEEIGRASCRERL